MNVSWSVLVNVSIFDDLFFYVPVVDVSLIDATSFAKKFHLCCCKPVAPCVPPQGKGEGRHAVEQLFFVRAGSLSCQTPAHKLKISLKNYLFVTWF